MPGTDRFSNAYVGEKLVLTFDFSEDEALAPGETLTGTPTVEIDVVAGTDPAPADLQNGSPVIVGGLAVLLPVDPAVGGVEYRLKITCASSNPLKQVAAVGYLYIEQEPA